MRSVVDRNVVMRRMTVHMVLLRVSDIFVPILTKSGVSRPMVI